MTGEDRNAEAMALIRDAMTRLTQASCRLTGGRKAHAGMAYGCAWTLLQMAAQSADAAGFTWPGIEVSIQETACSDPRSRWAWCVARLGEVRTGCAETFAAASAAANRAIDRLPPIESPTAATTKRGT